MRTQIAHEERDEITKATDNSKENDARFTEFMLKGNPGDNNIKIRKIEGTHFSENGVVEINADQHKLDVVMLELQQKFKQVS